MKARSLGRLWFAVLLAFPALPALAETCNVLLKDGVVDGAHINDTLDLANRVSGWFCDKHFASYEEATSAKLDARLPVDGLLIPFGLFKDHKNFRQAYQSFCQSGSATERLIKVGSLRPFIAANKALVSGYLACVQKGGLQAHLETSEDAGEFSLVTRWIPVDGAIRVEIRDVIAEQSGGKIECRPALPASGEFIDSTERRYLCSRDPARATTLTINTVGESRVLALGPHARYRLYRDEVSGESTPAIAKASSGPSDSAPVCVGGPDGNAALGNYVIDYHQTAGVRVSDVDAHVNRPKGSWSFSIKEPTRVCLVAHAGPATDAEAVAYKIHYVFYRYRLEKEHREHHH